VGLFAFPKNKIGMKLFVFIHQGRQPRLEPVLNFTANMSEDEVYSPHAAAAQPIPEEISCEELQSSAKFVSEKIMNMSRTR
jgi:hypothetical protein